MFTSLHRCFLWFVPLVALLFGLLLTSPLQAAPLSQSDAQNLQIIEHLGGQSTDMIVDGNYAYLIMGTRLVVLDIANPTLPTEIGHLPLVYSVSNMATANGYLYLAGGTSGLHILSLSDPHYPVEVGVFSTQAGVYGIVVQGQYLYIPENKGCDANGQCTSLLRIVDVARPASPVEIGKYSYVAAKRMLTSSIALAGNQIYLMDMGDELQGLVILDISNPIAPQFLSRLGVASWQLSDLTVIGNSAYISAWGFPPYDGPPFGWLYIIDVSDPRNPVETSNLFTTSRAHPFFTISHMGPYLYRGGHQQLQILNVSDPVHPLEEGTIDVDSVALSVVGNHLYNAASSKGFQSFDLSLPLSPTVMGGYNGGVRYASFEKVALENNFLYASGGGGIQLFDLSHSPAKLLSGLDINGQLLAVEDGMAYLSWSEHLNKFTDSYGFHGVDFTNKLSPAWIQNQHLGSTFMGYSSYPVDIQTLVQDRLYVTSRDYEGSSSGNQLYAFKLTPPLTPTLVGTYGPVLSTVLVNGNFAYAAGKPTGILVLDVTAATSPTLLSSYSAIGTVRQFAVANARLFAVSDGNLHIFDISNPTTLVEVGQTLPLRQGQRITANGAYLYLFASTDGVRVLDLIDPARPTEIARFTGMEALQVLPTDDNKLYITAGENGLFTLQLSGALAGKVVDSFGKAQNAVKVGLSNGQTTVTNGQGDYSFAFLAPGNYTVHVESSSYAIQPTEQALRVPTYSTIPLNFTLIPKAVETVVIPTSPTHLSYTDLQGNRIDFDLPARAIVQPTTLKVLPQASAAASGQFFTGIYFELQTIENKDGGSTFTFAAPLTITIHYTESIIAPISDSSQLALRWWNGSQWVDATSTCHSAIPPIHNRTTRVLVTAACQTGKFALFGPTFQRFLPIVARGQPTSAEIHGRFVAQHSGKCLNVLAESQQNWASIIQWPCVGGDNEIWTVRPQGQYDQIVAKHSQKCLNVSNASQAEGAQVIQYSCSGGDNELWRLLPVGDNLYQIVAKQSNQCLTVQDASQEDKAQVSQRNCSEGPNQIWRFQAGN